VKTVFKTIGICLALVLLGGVMAYLAGFFETKIPVDFRGVLPSAGNGQTVSIAITREPLIEKAAGTIRAKVETAVSPLITATISSIAVRAGDEVNQNDVLVQLDARELQARVDQAHQAVIAAKARMTRADKDAKRVQRIYKKDPGAVSKSDLDRVQAALDTARADLLRAQRQEDETKTALSYSKLIAPISGRVIDRFADPGDTARQGEPLLRMYDPESLRLEASVRESVASKLTKRQQLNVDIDALNQRFPAIVDEIVPSADPGSRTFLVKARLKEGGGLFPGMFGRLLIPIGEAEKIYIPIDAVTHVGQLDFVIVKTTDGPIRRYVRLGAQTRDNRVEVISGLAPEENILITPK